MRSISSHPLVKTCRVDVRVRALEHAVLEPLRLADAQDVARRFEGRDVRLLVGRVGDDEDDVDDRLRGDARHRGRADVLDPQRAAAERPPDSCSFPLEQSRPVRVVVGEQDRAVERLQLADRRRPDFGVTERDALCVWAWVDTCWSTDRTAARQCSGHVSTAASASRPPHVR
jgi:hypothetical protein